MEIKIALAGNPNSGKTTLFNHLTGSNQFVGNWPGVTVEKKEGKLKKSFYSNDELEVAVIDLPGIYSLSPYTLEEVVTRNYLLTERPDAIINIVDGTNIERNLYLSTQIFELGIPVVIAINMMDLVEKSGNKIDIVKLEAMLGYPIFEISALKGTGIKEVCGRAIEIANKEKNQEEKPVFSSELEKIISDVKNKIQEDIPENQKRFYAIKVLEKDEKIVASMKSAPQIENEIKKLEELYDDDSESIITNERYLYLSQIVSKCLKKNPNNSLTTSDKIDSILTNRIVALPIFAFIMFLVYFISVSTVGAWVTDFTNDGLFGEGFSIFSVQFPSIPGILEAILESIHTADWLKSLIVDGIVGGVGAVLGFVPQMMVLFFLLAFLEACGYMARVAFIMDRIFRRFGLSGKSFIPMLIGSGCSVPGIMASRTIENDKDRKMTIITTSFVPCGAKLPIIALIAGALFDGAWWVAPSSYFVGITAVLLSGIILKKTKLFSQEPAPFVMELPTYHMPTIQNLFRSMWERGWSFIKKAGTIILLSTIVLWFLMRFGWIDGSFRLLGETELGNSILAFVGSIIAPIFAPLGWGDWKMAVAALTGLIAKENVVGTFGVLYGMAEVSEDGAQIWGSLSESLTSIGAYSFLVFNLLCAPCFAAMGAIRREMNNGKWFAFAIVYQTVLAYVVSLSIYQIGNLIVNGTFGFGTVVAMICIIGLIVFLVIPKYGQHRTRK